MSLFELKRQMQRKKLHHFTRSQQVLQDVSEMTTNLVPTERCLCSYQKKHVVTMLIQKHKVSSKTAITASLWCLSNHVNSYIAEKLQQCALTCYHI